MMGINNLSKKRSNFCLIYLSSYIILGHQYSQIYYNNVNILKYTTTAYIEYVNH